MHRNIQRIYNLICFQNLTIDTLNYIQTTQSIKKFGITIKDRWLRFFRINIKNTTRKETRTVIAAMTGPAMIPKFEFLLDLILLETRVTENLKNIFHVRQKKYYFKFKVYFKFKLHSRNNLYPYELSYLNQLKPEILQCSYVQLTRNSVSKPEKSPSFRRHVVFPEQTRTFNVTECFFLRRHCCFVGDHNEYRC